MPDQMHERTELSDAAEFPAPAPGGNSEDQGALQRLASEETVCPQLPPAPLTMPRVVRALRHRNFRWFWAGNFLSNIGTWMQNVAQGWLVLQLADRSATAPVIGTGHPGAFWLGVVGFAASAPMLVFALLGGVIADRADRRGLMLRTQTVMMLCAFTLAALSYTGRVNIAEIVLLAFVTGTAMSLNTPSYQALVPELVPRQDLANAIALNSAQFNLSRVIGPTLGGFAMAAFGVAGNFLLNGLSFLAVLLALLRIHYPPPEPAGENSVWQDMTEGFRYVFARPAMSTLLLLVGISSILGFPFLVFVPLFARDILHVAERGLGLLMACSGTGAFLGAATIAYLGHVRRRGRLVMASSVLFFLGVIAFSLSQHFLISGIVLLLTGYVMILMVATVNTLLQHLASDEMRGRVMSMYATAFLGFAPLGSLMAGSLAGAVTAPFAIAIMAALGLVASLWVYFSRDALRRLD